MRFRNAGAIFALPALLGCSLLPAAGCGLAVVIGKGDPVVKTFFQIEAAGTDVKMGSAYYEAQAAPEPEEEQAGDQQSGDGQEG